MQVPEGDVVEPAALAGRRRAAQGGEDPGGHGVDAADPDVPLGLLARQTADDEGVTHDQRRDAGGGGGAAGGEVGGDQSQRAGDDRLVAAGQAPGGGVGGGPGRIAGRLLRVAPGAFGGGPGGVGVGGPGGVGHLLAETIGQQGRQGLAGGVGVEVGQGVDVQPVAAVGAGDDDRPVDVGDAGADGQALAQEIGGEAEAPGGVVVAGGEDDAGDVAQAAQGLVQEADGVGGRDGAVVDVPGHDDGVHGLGAGEFDEVVGEDGVGVVEHSAVEGPTQVPVGGVQDPHGRSLSCGARIPPGPERSGPGQRSLPCGARMRAGRCSGGDSPLGSGRAGRSAPLTAVLTQLGAHVPGRWRPLFGR